MPTSHNMAAKLLMGLPIHLLHAFSVLQKALLSNGACSSVPKIGNIHVVNVADMTGHV